MVLKVYLRKSEVGLIGLGIELQDPLKNVDQDGRLGFHFVGQLKLPEMGFRVARRVMYPLLDDTLGLGKLKRLEVTLRQCLVCLRIRLRRREQEPSQYRLGFVVPSQAGPNDCLLTLDLLERISLGPSSLSAMNPWSVLLTANISLAVRNKASAELGLALSQRLQRLIGVLELPVSNESPRLPRVRLDCQFVTDLDNGAGHRDPEQDEDQFRDQNPSSSQCPSTRYHRCQCHQVWPPASPRTSSR